MTGEPTVRELVETLRQAVVEAFSREVYPEKAEQRTALVNALQGILEKSDPNAAGMVEIDYEDLFALVHHREAILDAANLHERHFGNPDISRALRGVVSNIETAQQHLWRPLPEGPALDLDREDEPVHAAAL